VLVTDEAHATNADDKNYDDGHNEPSGLMRWDRRRWCGGTDQRVSNAANGWDVLTSEACIFVSWFAAQRAQALRTTSRLELRVLSETLCAAVFDLTRVPRRCCNLSRFAEATLFGGATNDFPPSSGHALLMIWPGTVKLVRAAVTNDLVNKMSVILAHDMWLPLQLLLRRLTLVATSEEQGTAFRTAVCTIVSDCSRGELFAVIARHASAALPFPTAAHLPRLVVNKAITLGTPHGMILHCLPLRLVRA